MVLSIILLTPCLKSQEKDKICLTISEMDYFVYQDLSQKALCKDTAEYKKQIATKNIQMALYKANEADYKSQISNSNTLLKNSKDELTNVRIDLNKQKDKVKRRGGIIIGSVTVNILFITIVAIKVL